MEEKKWTNERLRELYERGLACGMWDCQERAAADVRVRSCTFGSWIVADPKRQHVPVNRNTLRRLDEIEAQIIEREKGTDNGNDR